MKAHPKLLVGGVWCIADLEYMFTEDKNATPWVLASIKPIQLSHFDFDVYLAARKQFSTEEGSTCSSRALASIRRCSASATS